MTYTMAFILGGLLGTLFISAECGRRYVVKAKEKRDTSRPKSKVCRDILKKYNALPAESRVMGDISGALSALEIEYDADKVEHHFENRHHLCGMYHYKCPLPKIEQIIEAVDAVASAHRQREIALALSAVAHDREAATELSARMNEEARLIRSITNQMNN